jgi:hypothetical protein
MGDRAECSREHELAELLSVAEKWARKSGAVFEANKTASTHFVRLL